MDLLLFLLKSTVLAFFGLMELAMLARALLSWIIGPDSRALDFLIAVTEPVIQPVRALCDRFGWFQDMPIDMPFIITVFLISILEAIVEIF